MRNSFEKAEPNNRTKYFFCYFNYIFVFICFSLISSCNHNSDKKHIIPTNGQSVLTGIEVIGEKPITTPITTKNKPKIIPAGQPEIIADKSNGGLPFFISYSTDQGLNLNTVLSSICDKDGNIWFGTAGAGVSRYNGKNFTNYTIANGLASNVVFAIMEDYVGNLWFGTSAGLSMYDGYRFTTYTITNGLSGNLVSSIFQDVNKNIWIGTQDGGITKYDGKNFIHYNISDGLSDNYVSSIIADEDGKLWIGTASHGVNYFDGRKFINFSISDGLINNSINCIIKDRSGKIWFGTNAGVSIFDGKKFTRNTTVNSLADNKISSIIQDKNGNIWFGSKSGNLSRYDGESLKSYPYATGGSETAITSLLNDKAGNLWLTSLGSGVSRYLGDGISKYNQHLGLSGNMIFSMIQDQSQNIWFGTYERGLSIYNGKAFKNFNTSHGLPDNWIWSFMSDKEGNMWIATHNGGACKYDGKSFTIYTTAQGLGSNAVNCMMQDKKGNIWFGTTAGVSLFDGKSFTNFTTTHGLPGSNIIEIVQDNDENIWFATHDDGICKYDGRIFYWFKKEQGLASNYIYSCIKDQKGNIWIGTNNGLTKFDGKNFSSYTSADGLADNYIWEVVEDKLKNIIWLGTNKGVTALKEATSDNGSDNYEIKNYNEHTGFLKGVNTASLLVDTEGILWVASGHNELIRFNYSKAQNKSLEKPLLKIEGVKVNNENVSWHTIQGYQEKVKTADTLTILNDMVSSFNRNLKSAEIDSFKKTYRNVKITGVEKFYPIPKGLVLPYNLNSISFEFVTIEPVLQKQIIYQYKLEGHSKDWSPPGNNSTAVFDNINPGKYTLLVKSVTPFGNLAETSYTFAILPPWWRTWWAYILFSILVIGFFYFFYQLRLRNLQKKQTAQINIMVAAQEEERKRLSRDLHDDVGIKLSAIKMFLSSLYDKAFDINNKEILALARTSDELIGETMEDVRQLLVNLSPGVLEEFGYTTAVEGIVNKINETERLHFNLVIFGLKQRLHKDYELALFRITQELINNILKHAEAKQVSVQIGKRDEKIILMIEDDGKGFDVKSKKEGYGLHNLEIRTKLMSGTLTVDSQLGKGTSVLIEIPYNMN